MPFNKITIGYVIQTFDDTGQCTSQEFTASDDVTYEAEEDGKTLDEDDLPLGGKETYPLNMVQPEDDGCSNWQCPKCKLILPIDPAQLAEAGTPHCWNCEDTEMEPI